jgi:HAE1 family hydrophobic/amphiphilic exporter-1
MFKFATQRPVAVLMITCAAALFGALSYGQLGLELMPDLAHPTLTVRTEQPGAAPEEVEAEITRGIELRVGTVEGLLDMHSTSRAGLSEIVLSFDWKTDMDRAAQRVRERLARLRLPAQAEQPRLLRYDPTLVPVMRLAVGGQATLTTLRHYAETQLVPELSKIDGVAAVRVLGGLEREVHVQLSEAALSARGLTVDQVATRLRLANVNLAGGTVREGSVEFLVRTLAELSGPAELGQVVVFHDPETGARLRLADVAQVGWATRERRGLVRVGGQEAVRVDLYRRADANLVEVCDRVRRAVFGSATQQAWQGTGQSAKGQAGAKGEGAKGEGAKGKKDGPKDPKKAQQSAQRRAKKAAAQRRAMTDFIAHRRPEGTTIDVLDDQSLFVRAALDEVRQAALFGGLLAVLILYVFLRSGYSTGVIALAIPLSVAVTFAPLLLFGVGLNIMSLGGLALGVGMLVDNSVVVLESIHRCREAGDGPREAAVRGTQEVGSAVVASTLTTVAVFFPIVFVEGVAGQVFGDLALSVVFSLLASLAVALFVVPMLAARSWTTQRVAAPETPQHWRVRFTALPRWWASRARGWLRRLLMPVTLPYALLGALFEGLGNALILVAMVVGVPLVTGARLISTGARWALWPLTASVGWAIEATRRGYRRVLRLVLHAPLAVALITCALAAGAWQLGGDLGAELIPEVRQGVLIAELRFAVGTPLAETARRTQVFERGARALPDVARVEAFVGEPEAGEDDAAERGPHTAAVTVRVVAGATAEQEAAVLHGLRSVMAQMPGAELRVARPALFSLRPPIRVVVQGHHLGSLNRVGAETRAAVAAVPGITDVRSSLRPGFPEVQIAFDRGRLSALGLEPRTVAERLRAQVDGTVATTLRDGETLVDVRVRLDPARADARASLPQLVVEPGDTAAIPLEAVAQLRPGTGPAEIRHVDGQRAALISARTEGFDLGTAADGVRAALTRVPRPATFDLRLEGQDDEMRASLDSLKLALLLAIFLVYVVMASQFESLRAPLVIMGSLPLAGIGVLAVLGLFGVPLSVVVFVGLITLAGIVVNNAIVLVDYTQQLRARGLDVVEALVEAGSARLRPILMTTLTTVLGLLPMALDGGEGAELRQPMALALVGGLLLSTGLTLVVIPVLYRFVLPDRVDS